MRRVAAFDCGTNSLRLLVADLDEATGQSHELAREMEIVRLGQGVDRTGRLAESALARVDDVLERYVAQVRELGVEAVRFCATSAARDAENASDFSDLVRERVGTEPEVLTGEEEARLSYAGAVRSLAVGVDPPYLVLDVGGGSTELILGDDQGEVSAAVSLDVGSVRLTERHLHGDPPRPQEIEAAYADIDAILDAGLDGSGVDLSAAEVVVGVAGTVTTIAAGVLDLATYERQLVHHSVIRRGSVESTTRQLLAMTIEERKALGYLHPGRADVIAAGGMILERVLARTTVGSILVSESDILDGIAWSLA